VLPRIAVPQYRQSTTTIYPVLGHVALRHLACWFPNGSEPWRRVRWHTRIPPAPCDINSWAGTTRTSFSLLSLVSRTFWRFSLKHENTPEPLFFSLISGRTEPGLGLAPALRLHVPFRTSGREQLWGKENILKVQSTLHAVSRMRSICVNNSSLKLLWRYTPRRLTTNQEGANCERREGAGVVLVKRKQL